MNRNNNRERFSVISQQTLNIYTASSTYAALFSKLPCNFSVGNDELFRSVKYTAINNDHNIPTCEYKQEDVVSHKNIDLLQLYVVFVTILRFKFVVFTILVHTHISVYIIIQPANSFDVKI